MKRKPERLLPLLPIMLGVMLACLAANGASLQFQSSERQVALVELYTSEGCSSCPPAESWLSGRKQASGLWSDFVPVAFHIDYWNNLGWRDPWSNKDYSGRQRDYAALWRSENIYTPEFVLNGKEWRNWLGWRTAPGLSDIKVGVLTIRSRESHRWDVSFAPSVDGTNACEINAALLICGLGSDVKAGENSGRHLRHDFVVLNLVSQPLRHQQDGYQGAFLLPVPEKPLPGRLALAAWIAPAGRPEPIQAVGGWLDDTQTPK